MHFVCKTENKMVDKSQFVGKKWKFCCVERKNFDFDLL